MKMEIVVSSLDNMFGVDFANVAFNIHKTTMTSRVLQERNNGDVKEMIPEFFYLPEFLRNTNRFDFGTKQNGEV
jgi:hypothetical protein